MTEVEGGQLHQRSKLIGQRGDGVAIAEKGFQFGELRDERRNLGEVAIGKIERLKGGYYSQLHVGLGV